MSRRQHVVAQLVALAVVVGSVILGGVLSRATGAEWRPAHQCVTPPEVATMELGQGQRHVERVAGLRGAGAVQLVDGPLTVVRYEGCHGGWALVSYGTSTHKLASAYFTAASS